MTDGSTFYRSFGHGPAGFAMEGNHDPRLRGRPLVLRRNDIHRFWATPEEQRRLVFMQYFGSPSKDPVPPLETASERTERLSAELSRATADRRAIAAKIGRRFRVDPNALPASRDGLVKLLHGILAKDLGMNAKWATISRSIGQNDHDMISEYGRACELVRRLRDAKKSNPLVSTQQQSPDRAFLKR